MVYVPYDSRNNNVKLVTILCKHLVRTYMKLYATVSKLLILKLLTRFTKIFISNIYSLYCVYRCSTKMVYTLNTALEDELLCSISSKVGNTTFFCVGVGTTSSRLKQLFVIVNIVVQDNFFIRLIILFTFILSLRCWSYSKTLSIMF